MHDNVVNSIQRAFVALVSTAAVVGTAVSPAAAAPVHPTDTGHQKIVVFVDTGNTGRSLMAEELSRRILAEKHWTDIEVLGRGTKVDPTELAPEKFAAQLLAARGIDVAGHTAAPLTAHDVASATVILAVAAKNQKQVVAAYPSAGSKTDLLAQYAVGEKIDVEDAWGKPLSAYEQTEAQLDRYLPAALAKVHALP